LPPITLHYSEKLVRNAVKAFWWRRTGWGYLFSTALLFAATAYAVWRGNRSWWVPFSGAILVFGILVAAALFIVHYRRSVGNLRRMKTPEALLELDDEHFAIRSDLGSSKLLWNAITEVWRFPTFWLLLLSHAQFLTVPTADLDSTAQEWILTRVSRAGARIS
jgi:YcxB-like protein